VCDTIVVVGSAGEPTWFAKNSDRAPAEAQVLELRPSEGHRLQARVHCGVRRIPQAHSTHSALLSRPAWMWGCEMGVNERGVAIGNEAVFTRLRVPRVGLTGMDLVRLALERAASADEALEVITDLLARYDQGGTMGYRNPRFRYHSSFAIADASTAWILETAGPFWAAQKVKGARTLSNVLSIGRDFDRIHERAYEFARNSGWCSRADDFDFAGCYGRGFYRVMSGGEQRAACTSAALGPAHGDLSPEVLAEVLRDHGGLAPDRGLRAVAPCAHASWLPTRTMAQTTGSLIARLDANTSVWATGTSSPCLSVFKPVPMGRDILSQSPRAEQRADADSLWWRQHRLHGVVIGDYPTRRAVFERDRLDLQTRAFSVAATDGAQCLDIWEAHRNVIPEWTQRAAGAGRTRLRPFHLYWRAQTAG